MKRKFMTRTNLVVLSWCTSFMIVFGITLPPMIREDELPEITLYEVALK